MINLLEVEIDYLSVQKDLDQCLGIEAACFPFPWSEGDFLANLREQHIIGMVAKAADRVVGYYVYEIRLVRLIVTNFAVHPDYRKSGVGAQMVDSIKSRMLKGRQRRISLAIGESNLRGLNFFKSQGFKAIKLLRGHWEEPPEDAIKMEYRASGQYKFNR
jgi:[ribosomal protein S18]-alanine N-acetyltransferase